MDYQHHPRRKMKQLLQFNREKCPRVEDIPEPQMKGPGLLVNNRCSLISVGTERQMIEVSQMSLLGKARQRPDMVRQVLAKMKTEGMKSTYDKVIGRLSTPTSLGYSSSGIVEEVHSAVENWLPGDRAACAGFGYACHAEKIFVPANLAVKIPENVSYEEASFVTLGAIALQGVRIADIRLGETVAVIGLGLLGQITCMLLSASGCRVIGLDIDPDKVALSLKSGAECAFMSDGSEAVAVMNATSGRGADAVIITAASDSAAPVASAGEICRDRGKVVAVGAVKLDVPRKTFYDKELELRLSRSYGPGRYDYYYEEAGKDYPFSYVRWTENRNMESFLQLISQGKINIKSLITHRFDIDDASRAYEMISGATNEKYLGVVFNYKEDNTQINKQADLRLTHKIHLSHNSSAKIGIGFVGAGNYASGVLLPNIAAINGFERIAIMSGSGVSAAMSSERFGFKKAVSSFSEIINDRQIGSVFIANRHDQHARMVSEALLAGKATFVEKPLCINREELDQIRKSYEIGKAPLMVGFNRRFAPFAEKIKEAVGKIKYPVSMHYRINAGFIPSGTWIQDPESGAGRIIGESCHFIDLLSFIAGSRPMKLHCEALTMPDERYRSDDNVQIMIKYANGSVGTINYVASGNKAASKEYLEILGGGIVIMMDDFKTLTIIDEKGKRDQTKKSQNKGHRKMLETWQMYLASGLGSPIPFDQIVSTTQATFEILDSLADGEPRWISE
jgi:predicted dehydrogenase/threonine dehydrogenase-like Zn-dependent dehydrogenase